MSEMYPSRLSIRFFRIFCFFLFMRWAFCWFESLASFWSVSSFSLLYCAKHLVDICLFFGKYACGDEICATWWMLEIETTDCLFARIWMLSTMHFLHDLTTICQDTFPYVSPLQVKFFSGSFLFLLLWKNNCNLLQYLSFHMIHQHFDMKRVQYLGLDIDT